MATAEDVLNVARGEIGYSRWDDPEEGTKYGRWFAAETGDPYYGESGVPYCAMFASWCFAQAGASFPAFPSAYCPDIVNAAYEAGRTPYNEDARPGDLVLFDWGGDGIADHVGIVEENHPESETMTTIEGNTSAGSSGSQGNGGGVYRRVRHYSQIRCIVRPYYDEAAPSAPAEDGDQGDDSQDTGGIAEDGVWGEETTRALQRILGTPEDGTVSSQWSGDEWRHAGCPAFEHDDSGDGSLLIKAWQSWLNARGYDLTEDGLCGPATINDTIHYFREDSGADELDGRFDCPSITIAAMQRATNRGDIG